MASAASTVRLVVSAVVVAGGVFACLRVLGAGFAWSPGMGRADA